MSDARPLFHRKRKSICDLAMSQKCQEETFGRIRSVSFFTHVGEPEAPSFGRPNPIYAPKAGEFTNGIEIDAPASNDAGCRIRGAVWITRASGRHHGLECKGRRNRNPETASGRYAWSRPGDSARCNVRGGQCDRAQICALQAQSDRRPHVLKGGGGRFCWLSRARCPVPGPEGRS